MRVAQHRGIRLIEMLPTDHPNQAYGHFDSGITVSQYANAVNMMAGLYQGTHDGRGQIVPS